MKQKLVRDWMSKKVIIISPKTALPEAHRLMSDHNIRRLPVLKNNQLVGMLTLGDVRGAEPSEATSLSIWEVNYLLAKMKINQTMSPNPITISEDATIANAAKVMLDHKISGLPVVNETGDIVGIITESDIFRMIVNDWHQ
ncbi:CBS domain-containing protein [Anaerolineales bacterium HSG24]|nr:CBS domain-containing protein [Anaerolineales bacterium HSG24]